MTSPVIGVGGTAVADYSSPASTGTTNAFAVNLGDSVYVFIGYETNSGGGITVSSVTDSSGNSYKKAAGKQNTSDQYYPASEVWYADNVMVNPSLKVTVNFSSSTAFALAAVEIAGANPTGSLDAVSSGNAGLTPTSDPTSLDPITVNNPGDLVIANYVFMRGAGTQTSGGGFTGSTVIQANGTSDVEDLWTQGWYEYANAIGSYDSKMYTQTSVAYAIITVAIKPGPLWSAVVGKPFVTVSAKGVKNGSSPLVNGGADFGPDTSNTTTSGIQEAINSGAQEIHLAASGALFDTSSSIILPANGGIRLIGVLTNLNQDSVTGNNAGVYIVYSGSSGYAIDTNSSAEVGQYIKGFIDGIGVYSPNASGVRLKGAFYDIGSMWIGGNGAASSIGLDWEPISQPAEMHARFLHIDGFATLVNNLTEHLSIDHLSTSDTNGSGPIISHSGYALTILYWHHFGSGTAQPSALIDIANSTGTAVHIVNLLWETETYDGPSTAYFTSSGGTTFLPAVTVDSINLVTSGGVQQSPTAPLGGSAGLVAVTNFINLKQTTRLPIIVAVDDRATSASDSSPITIYTVGSLYDSTDELLKIDVGLVVDAYGNGTTMGYVVSYEDSAGNGQSVSLTLVHPSTAPAYGAVLIRCKQGTGVAVQASTDATSGASFSVTCTVTRVQDN